VAAVLNTIVSGLNVNRLLHTAIFARLVVAPDFQTILDLRTNRSTGMTAKAKKEEAILYKCEPLHWVSFPKPLRLVLGWATVLMFGFSFLTVPMCFVFFIPAVWRTAPVAASVALGSVVLCMCLPLKEWYV
jgi:hypothetical protein